MRLYTRTGDAGTTGLIGGSRVSKNDAIIAAVGDLDELNTVIGMTRAVGVHEEIDQVLEWIQSILFDCGAEAALGTPANLSDATEKLERSIDEQIQCLPTLTAFILPGGSVGASALHHARAVCRRAERSVVELSHNISVREEFLAFLNRLSDWFFSAARYENYKRGVEEVLWSRTT